MYKFIYGQRPLVGPAYSGGREEKPCAGKPVSLPPGMPMKTLAGRGDPLFFPDHQGKDASPRTGEIRHIVCSKGWALGWRDHTAPGTSDEGRNGIEKAD